MQGKLKVQETTYDGQDYMLKKLQIIIVNEIFFLSFEKAREAFYGLFKGENTGKAIVKA